MRRILILLVIVCLALADLSVASPRKGGGNGKGGGVFNRALCSREANRGHKTCTDACKVTFAQDMKVCQAKSLAQKECMEGCLTAKTACMEEVKIPLTDCLSAANAVLDAELSVCGVLTDVATKLTCDNAAKVKAFSARLDCAKQFQLNAEAQAKLKMCGQTATSCLAACRSLPVVTPTAAPTEVP